MVSVCVVGGGTSGSAAAAEASARGAEVTVVEKAERPDPPWKSWPDLIRAIPLRFEAPPPKWSLPLPDRTVEDEARSVAEGEVVTSEGTLRPDRVVLATGCSFEPPKFLGRRKPGVAVLESFREYERLGRESSSTGEITVTGEGGRGLEVAERLSGPGKHVNLFVSHWKGGPPSSMVLDVISSAASERGVSVTSGTVAKALGATRLEAVLANDRVFACDTMVYVPRKLPRTIRVPAEAGPLGGHLVDQNLRTSIPSVFAAGGCAELEGQRPPRTFEDEPALSGRMAGSNCTGDEQQMGRVKTTESFVFGLLWCRIETLSLRPPSVAPLSTVARRWDESSACEINFESSTKRVVRVESVERSGPIGLPRLPVPSEMSLQSLAYGLGSSDISLISETARSGVARWQEC